MKSSTRSRPASRKLQTTVVSSVQGAAINSWAVIAVDGTPLRSKAQRNYQKALRDLDSAKTLLATFHERDQPLFSQWINRNFGTLLTEIRELHAKLLQAQHLIFEVDQEYFYGGHSSLASAYREVMRRRTQPDPAAFNNPAAEEDEEEDFRREFEEAFGKTPEDFWARLGEEQEQTHAPQRVKSNAPSSSNRRLKELYRILAHRLHPDKAAGLAPAEKEWWYETQAAYESGNLEQMEMILTLVEVHDNGTRETSISALAKLTEGFKQRLRALKRQISKLRSDPAWNFSNRADHSTLFHPYQASLMAEREEIASHLAQCHFQITKWERASARFNRPRRRARSESTL